MTKIGRNDLCYCGSGKKYKKCCMEKDIENNKPDILEYLGNNLKQQHTNYLHQKKATDSKLNNILLSIYDEKKLSKKEKINKYVDLLNGIMDYDLKDVSAIDTKELVADYYLNIVNDFLDLIQDPKEEYDCDKLIKVIDRLLEVKYDDKTEEDLVRVECCLYFKNKMEDKAEELVSNYVNKNPKSSTLYNVVADNFDQMGNDEKAEKYYRLAING